MRTLYLCYFGIREPLVRTQVLPYLRQLAAGGIDVSLLTFEPDLRAKWSDDEAEAMRAKMAAEGIGWHFLPYHKWPSLPATLYDIVAGAWYSARLAKRERIEIFHGRAHVAAAMGALAKRIIGGKLIFDIRGFMPEEYTDAGIWKENGWLYRGMKAVERWLMKSSDAFIVLTERAREILFPGCTNEDERGKPIEVIPCCVDLQRFQHTASRREVRREMGLERRRVIVYVGSFGGWYLTDEMMDFFAVAHRQDRSSFALILTQSDRNEIEHRLIGMGLGEQDFLVGVAAPSDIPRYLKAADVALSFIRICYSKQASSPTKIAEYLISGLPIVSNAGIGDLDGLIEGERVGRLVREFTPECYRRVLNEIDELREDENLIARCRDVALAQFDLECVGGVRYRRLYERLRCTTNLIPSLRLGLPWFCFWRR